MCRSAVRFGIIAAPSAQRDHPRPPPSLRGALAPHPRVASLALRAIHLLAISTAAVGCAERLINIENPGCTMLIGATVWDTWCRRFPRFARNDMVFYAWSNQPTQVFIQPGRRGQCHTPYINKVLLLQPITVFHQPPSPHHNSAFCIQHSAFQRIKKSAPKGGFFNALADYTLLGAGTGSWSLRILASAIRCLGHTVAHRPQETHLL